MITISPLAYLAQILANFKQVPKTSRYLVSSNYPLKCSVERSQKTNNVKTFRIKGEIKEGLNNVFINFPTSKCL
jgi:hypothetical protein